VRLTVNRSAPAGDYFRDRIASPRWYFGNERARRLCGGESGRWR